MNITHKYDIAFRMLERDENSLEKLSKDDILEIHDILIDRIGGSFGIRDTNLLESVCEAPYSGFGDMEFYPNLFSKTAKYMFDFCNYQIFVDGNKRTGVATAEILLNKNGYEMTLTNEEVYDLAIDIATGKITDPSEVKKIISDHVKFYDFQLEEKENGREQDHQEQYLERDEEYEECDEFER